MPSILLQLSTILLYIFSRRYSYDFWYLCRAIWSSIGLTTLVSNLCVFMQSLILLMPWLKAAWAV